MARSGKLDDVLYYGAILGGGFLGYRMALQGSLGAGAQKFATDIHRAFAGTSVTVGTGGVSVGGGGGALPSGGTFGGNRPGTGGCDQRFIDGVRYVADLHNGSFETVIGGRQVFVGSQADAEAYYRAHVCG